MNSESAIKKILKKIYGDRGALQAARLLDELIEKYTGKLESGSSDGRRGDYFDQSDVVLITYGDSLFSSQGSPLSALHSFLQQRVRDCFSSVHILPFFPFSSDDGFSVCDYYKVNPDLGDWQDIKAIEGDFQLMADLVINHVSAKSEWFRRYLAGDPEFDGLPIEADSEADLSRVTRPRALPLLTPFTRESGEQVQLWTTFSEDQVDLNFADPRVMARMMDVLLFYVSRGATSIRLDAIAYLWKEIGTDCIHHPKTHEVVRLMRAVLDTVAPDVILITETNVPHGENVSYFSDGGGEAQMVYNFSLPPLLLHSFLGRDTKVLESWARDYLDISSPDCTFFNFTASHDGVGVRPLEGIAAPDDIQALVDHVRMMGGDVGLKRNPDGSDSPYELNITYVDAMRQPGGSQGDSGHARRFMASQEIQFSLPGVPAVYIHSLLGSRNWNEGVESSGIKRRINRQRLELEQVMAELDTPGSFRALVFEQYCRLIRLRRGQPALHPNSELKVLYAPENTVLALRRRGGGQTLYALSNVSPEPCEVKLAGLGIPDGLEDILGGQLIDDGKLLLEPHRTSWLV